MSNRVSISFVCDGVEMLATLDYYDIRRIRRAMEIRKNVGKQTIQFVHPMNIVRVDGGPITDTLGISAARRLLHAIAEQAPMVRLN